MTNVVKNIQNVAVIYISWLYCIKYCLSDDTHIKKKILHSSSILEVAINYFFLLYCIMFFILYIALYKNSESPI